MHAAISGAHSCRPKHRQRERAAYGSAKAALVHSTITLAAETAPFGVSVFAIPPGRVKTAMTEYVVDSPAGRLVRSAEEIRRDDLYALRLRT